MVTDIRFHHEKHDNPGRPQRVTVTFVNSDDNLRATFEIEEANLAAAAIRFMLRSELAALFSATREQAYKQGWHDKASKTRRKCREFSGYPGLVETVGW